MEDLNENGNDSNEETKVMVDNESSGSNDSDEESKVVDDAEASGNNLKKAIKSFRAKAEVANGGFVSLKEYIERNGRRFTERPLGE